MATFPPHKNRNLLDEAVELLAESGGIAVVTMEGESMLPTLRPGQRVAVDFSALEPERGDLALFRQQDYHVVHRVLGPASSPAGGGCLRARGDHLPALDPPVAPASVRGTVVAIEQAPGLWWNMRGGGARLYAIAAALHGLFWAGMAVLGGKADAMATRAGGRPRLRELASRCDRAALGVAHRLFFSPCHRQGGLPRSNDDDR